MNPQNEYRSLMLRKAQLLAQEHGGISNIPRDKQRELGFDVIAGRKGFSVSVRVPEGDLSSRIKELKKGLPAVKAFGKSKPGPDSFGKYVPIPSAVNPTMDDFWIMQGWYKDGKTGIKLTRAKWSDNKKIRIDAIRFLVEKVLKKDSRDILLEDFESNRLSGLMDYYNGSPYAALLEAGYLINPWEMVKTPAGFYKSKENRIAATRWLAQKLQKDPRCVVWKDFISNRLSGLVSVYYDSSPYAALLEAGLVTPEDEGYMRREGWTRFSEL